MTSLTLAERRDWSFKGLGIRVQDLVAASVIAPGVLGTDLTILSVPVNLSRVVSHQPTAMSGFNWELYAPTTSQWMLIASSRERDPAYEASRTTLGSKLRQLRKQTIEAGEPLASWSDIERITSELRGGVE
jgi:hypothetical protein